MNHPKVISLLNQQFTFPWYNSSGGGKDEEAISEDQKIYKQTKSIVNYVKALDLKNIICIKNIFY